MACWWGRSIRARRLKLVLFVLRHSLMVSRGRRARLARFVGIAHTPSAAGVHHRARAGRSASSPQASQRPRRDHRARSRGPRPSGRGVTCASFTTPAWLLLLHRRRPSQSLATARPRRGATRGIPRARSFLGFCWLCWYWSRCWERRAGEASATRCSSPTRRICKYCT